MASVASGAQRSTGGWLPYLPGVGAAQLGLAAGREQLALPRLLACLAGAVIIPGRGAQCSQGTANITPSVTKPSPPLGPSDACPPWPVRTPGAQAPP